MDVKKYISNKEAICESLIGFEAFLEEGLKDRMSLNCADFKGTSFLKWLRLNKPDTYMHYSKFFSREEKFMLQVYLNDVSADYFIDCLYAVVDFIHLQSEFFEDYLENADACVSAEKALNEYPYTMEHCDENIVAGDISYFEFIIGDLLIELLADYIKDDADMIELVLSQAAY